MKKLLISFAFLALTSCALAQAYGTVSADTVQRHKAEAYSKKMTLDQFYLYNRSFNGNPVNGVTSSITTTDTTQVIAASSTNRIRVTHLTVTNGSASTGTWVSFFSKNTKIFTVYVVAQGGATLNFPPENPLNCSTSQAFRVKCETNATDVRVSAIGYITK